MRQPDQDPQLWDNHVSVYEEVFEPFTQIFADAAIARLDLKPGQLVLDSGAGAGGAAIAMAKQGIHVTAVDAAPGMVARMRARAAEAGVALDARVMNGEALDLRTASFDAAVSVFGVILFPDAMRGLAEMVRVVRPGGRISVVTWTEPERYELAARLRATAVTVWPEMPHAPLPPQLRYREGKDFRTLFESAGCGDVLVERVEAGLHAPSARWLVERIAFAPGMAAMLASLGDRRQAILDRFLTDLEVDHGAGALRLGAVAFVGTARLGAK